MEKRVGAGAAVVSQAIVGAISHCSSLYASWQASCGGGVSGAAAVVGTVAPTGIYRGGAWCIGRERWMVVSELCSSEYALWYNRAVDEWLRKVAEVVAKGD